MGSINKKFKQYAGETLKRLKSRWENQQTFLINEKDFWKASLESDFDISPDILKNIGTDYDTLYKDLYELKRAMAGTFFPFHTKQFIIQRGYDGTLLSLLVGNRDLFKAQLQNTPYTQDEIKELHILAAYAGHQDVVDYLGSEYDLVVDSELLNMAILSGKFVGDSFRNLTQHCKPTYDSIRYAIRSGRVDLLDQLLNEYHLKPSSEHFVVAASVGSVGMFNVLLAHGIQPQGELVMTAAARSKNDEMIALVEAMGMVVPHPIHSHSAR